MEFVWFVSSEKAYTIQSKILLSVINLGKLISNLYKCMHIIKIKIKKQGNPYRL
jgi:hypothetical protein